MANRSRSNTRYRNPVKASGWVFLIVLAVMGIAFGGSLAVFSHRKTSRENDIAKMRAEMVDYRNEIKSQRSLQASLLNRETLQGRLVELNSVLIEIPTHEIRYIENRVGHPALLDDQTGIATTGGDR